MLVLVGDRVKNDSKNISAPSRSCKGARPTAKLEMISIDQEEVVFIAKDELIALAIRVFVRVICHVIHPLYV